MRKNVGTEDYAKVLTLFHHLLDGTRRVDLHREQVVEPVHLCRILGELLAECVREVVCRICRLDLCPQLLPSFMDGRVTYNEQHRLPTACQLDGQRTRGRRLAWHLCA